MFDQSFSAKNFRKIIDYQNRKGVYLEGKYFPDLDEITKRIKSTVVEIRNLKKNKRFMATEDYEKKRLELNKNKDKLKQQKENLLMKKLDDISDSIVTNDFSLDVKEIHVGTAKKAYTIGDSVPAYFALKQVQYNIRKLYKAKQGNRHHIVSQVREVLSDKFPKYIVRTDISSFYESIPRNELWKKINEDTLLTLASKRIIKQVLHEYHLLSGNSVGVPRGIGISAYLAELYMRGFDREVSTNDEVVYYARYVDDIFVVYSPEPNSDYSKFRKNIEDNILDLGLNLNSGKTADFFFDGTVNKEVSYLGYKFKFGEGETTISLTDEKVKRYKNRIDLSFNKYAKESKRNEKKARKILVKRIRFLTGNTRLLNNKKNAVVGVYFSNNLLNDKSCLNDLDNYLIKKIESHGVNALSSKYSFVSGFNSRKFHKFSESDLKHIVEVWKYAS